MKEEPNKNNIIYRCEEVTEQEIREVIRKFDVRTVNGVKRLTRAGMGLCQGRTCGLLVEKIMTEEANKKVSELLPFSARPPTRPIRLGSLANEKIEKKDVK